MAFVKLNIPVLVQTIPTDNGPQYRLRPLFMEFPFAVHRRFDAALSQLQKEIKTQFQGFVLGRENLDHLLWFLFHPELSYKVISIKMTVGKQYFEGPVGIAFFELQGKIFGCIPSFNNYLFLVSADATQKINRQERCEEVIKALLRSYKKSGIDLVPEEYFSPKGAFLTSLSLNRDIALGSFKHEKQNLSWFFSKMSNDTAFNGAIEIERVGYDMNSLYPSELKRAYYREDLVDRLYHNVYRRENSPLVLIGKDGVGKHTVVHEIVHQYLSQQRGGNTNMSLQKIWHIDPTRIIAGMSVVGWWQKRFEAIIKHVRDRIKETTKKEGIADKILIDNPVAMLRIGKSSQNSMTLSDVIKPYLEKRQLQLIIIATPEEWKVIQEKDRRFTDLFQVLRIQEPDYKTAAKMVLQQRKFLEITHECEFTIQSINHLFTIQRNYLKSKVLPGSIMKLMNQLAVKYRRNMIDVPEVRNEFRAFSGLHEKIFDASYTFNEGEVRKKIANSLVGQEKAVDTLADVIHTIKAKLTTPGKPLGSFMFIGPTGVGKTQAAKVLAQYLMGNEDHLMRFDMNEYIDNMATHRLIGDYYNPEGQLTGKVRYRPFGIILFDEIEKAHPKVHDLLLQVLDDGRLTDSLGRTVDFSNTIIIMTSNVGAKEVSLQLGFDTASRDESAIYRKAVENKFRPEFINRIDRIVIFNPLKKEHILNIARLQIKELLSRDGFVRRTTILNISQSALEWVANRGFDARMGGRALKRQIERDLTTLSAEQLIASPGDQPIILEIELEEDRLVPNITPIEFINSIGEDWFPTLPDESKGKSFYNKLIRDIENLERRVQRMEESNSTGMGDVIVIGNEKGDQLNWQYYDFKDKIAAIKEKVTHLSLGFRDKYFKDGPAIPLRLKGGSFNHRSSFKVVRENVRDRLFQQEALKEISESYEYASAQFNSLETEFIDSYINVSFLKLSSIGFLKNKVDQIKISFESCINGMGQNEVAFLINQYTRFLEHMNIHHEVNKKEAWISAEGHSLNLILEGENGIHLFYKSHQNPLPIRMIIKSKDQKVKKLSDLKVIRIYDGDSTLTDLRTGFSNDFNLTNEEFKLLIFAGLKNKRF